MAQERPSTTTLTYHDPARCFEGSPYDAAGAAAEQAGTVLTLAALAISDTNIQARNAWMQRNMDSGGPPRGHEWEEDPQAKALKSILEEITVALRRMKAIRAAAAYDPKAPLPR